VLYLAGYKRVQDRYKVEEIEHAADCVVWCCDEAPAGRFCYFANTHRRRLSLLRLASIATTLVGTTVLKLSR
jgi:hypothetical protein